MVCPLYSEPRSKFLAKTLEKLNEALDGSSLLPLKLVTLGSDGPNVNKQSVKLMSDEGEVLRGLVQIGCQSDQKYSYGTDGYMLLHCASLCYC